MIYRLRRAGAVHGRWAWSHALAFIRPVRRRRALNVEKRIQMITRNKVEQPRIDIHAHVIPPAILGKAGPHGPDIMVDDEGVIIIRAGDYKLRGETVAAKREAEKGCLDRRRSEEHTSELQSIMRISYAVF